MGFLRKIFRRNKGDSTNTAAVNNNSSTSAVIPNDMVGNSTNSIGSSTARKSWRNSTGNSSNNKASGNGKGQSSSGTTGSSLRPHQLDVREDSPTQLLVDDIAFIPPSMMNGSQRRVALRGPDESDGTQRPILSPRNMSTITNAATFSNSINNQSKGSLKLTSHSTPVDLDDSQSESVIESIHSREPSTHPFEEKKTENVATEQQQQQQQQPPSSSPRAPIFTMPDSTTASSTTMMLPKLRFSAGNVSVGSEDTDGESSSFNLSTDAEDTEYEAMRRRLGATAMTVSSNMDMSVANYTTDGETSVFPGLQSEDDMTQTTASVTKEASQNSILRLPTVNPATGASLVPVGYTSSSSNSHPYAGSVGFPGAAAYNNKSSTDRLSNQLKAEESGKNNINLMNGMIKPKDDSSSNNNSRFSKPKMEDSVDDTSQPRTGSSHRLGNRSTTPTSSIPALELSKRDSPDPKTHRSSPKVNKSIATSNIIINNNNDDGFTQYDANFPTNAVYGSPTANNSNNNNNKNASPNHPQPQPTQRRSFTSPKKASSTVVDKPTTTTTSVNFDPFTMDSTAGFPSSNDMDLFADFADFSNFDNAFTSSMAPSLPTQNPSEQIKVPTVVERVGRSAASPFIERPDEKARTTRHTSIGSTTSNGGSNQNYRISAPSAVLGGAAQNDTSLSELLEMAKSKSSRSSHARKASTSVNSAPAHMTASYLRQHHNLPGNKSRSLSKGGSDGASVTDIIQSLEAANATRLTSGGSSSHSLGGGNGRHSHPTTNGTSGGGYSSRDDGFSSAHSREGGSSVISKEKIRRRRERRHARGVDAHSSDSENELEDNESWLFDEVTGALGPRGIAADLESLSGRSNRSSSSRGNKSHRSHRSHKSGSRSSRQRRPKTDSADSVDSHHSRDSRRSRGSRYSHKSTRSYISQMSEQSRSVANDLLRLEMQLAMVGSAGVPGLEGGSSSVGGIARNTRSSARITPPITTQSSSVPSNTSATGARRMATARRSRITIQAPAGRLGIILANKADARGTVVSGVRSSSALVDRITPGDRIVAIDGEDVSLMTVSEITTIMARKADFERSLTVLTTPRHTEPTLNTSGSVNSPRSASDSFQQQQRTSYRG